MNEFVNFEAKKENDGEHRHGSTFPTLGHNGVHGVSPVSDAFV